MADRLDNNRAFSLLQLGVMLRMRTENTSVTVGEGGDGGAAPLRVL